MVNQKWELFHIGMVRGEWIGIDDGMIVEWSNESGLTLFVFYNRPSEIEMAHFSAKSRFEIAFTDIEEIGFFSLKFGDEGWADCSFSPNLYSFPLEFAEIKEGKTYALHIMFIDSAKGELKLMRSIALGKEFSEHFRKWCLESVKRNIGRQYYNRIVDKVFKEYPSSELAEKADIRWVCPHGEEEKERKERGEREI